MLRVASPNPLAINVFLLTLLLAIFEFACEACGNKWLKRWTASEIPNLQRLLDIPFEEGDIIMMKDRTLWIAYSDVLLASIEMSRREVFAKVLFLDTRRLENPNLKAAKIEIFFPQGWSKIQAVALIHRLGYKQLPYSRRSCNGKNYMRYIIYVETYHTTCYRTCPLRRDLKNLQVDQINQGDFYLVNSSQRRVHVDKDLPVIQPYFEHQRESHRPRRFHLPQLPSLPKLHLPHLPHVPDLSHLFERHHTQDIAIE